MQLLEILLPLPNLEARINASVDLITQNHRDLSHEALAFAAASFYKKLKAGDKYVPQSKYHGNVMLLKAKTHNEYGEGLGGDYKLSEVSNINRRNWKFFCGFSPTTALKVTLVAVHHLVMCAFKSH